MTGNLDFNPRSIMNILLLKVQLSKITFGSIFLVEMYFFFW